MENTNEDEKITMDIVFLTNTMSRLQTGLGPDDLRSKTDRTLSTFRHIATLLTTGTQPDETNPGDLNTEHVIAVTGRADLDDMKMYCSPLFVSRNGNETGPTVKVLFDSDSTQDDVQLAVDNGLDSWMLISREDYYKYVFAVLNAVSKPSQHSDLWTNFMYLVIKHTYPKIAARLAKANTLWSKHPLTVLMEHTFCPAWCASALPRTFTLARRRIRNLLRQAEVEVTEQEDGTLFSFEVTERNIKAVCGVYNQLFQGLSGHLLDSSNRCKKLELQKDIQQVLDILLSLYNASLLVGLLFEDPSIPLMDAYHELPDLNENQDPEDIDIKAPEETLGQHVVRYLNTIAACVKAAGSLQLQQKLKLPLRSHLIVVSSPRLDVTPDIVHHIRDRICQDLTPATVRESVEILLDSESCVVKLQAKEMNATTIHAEAGLMALICAARTSTLPPSLSDSLRDVFSVNDIETAIGAVNKCCWCCWRLSQLLNQHTISSSGPATTLPKFLLRGTHGGIFPWFPPQFGLPPGVLETLRDELIGQICRAAAISSSRSEPHASHDGIKINNIATLFEGVDY